MGNIASRNFDPLTDLVDLKGKVAIVTGGNTGIGLETVRHLARAGAKVYLAARNESRATGALAQLEHDGLGPGNGQVIWLKLDLSDPRDAKKAAEDFLKKEARLDILVNNAALLQAPYEIGSDGVATMAVVNYISPFVFTETLLPLLQKTAREPESDVRIVNVSSITYKLIPASVKFDDISDFNVTYKGRLLPGLHRYGHTKFMIILWTKTLQRRLNGDATAPITALSIHPGGVDTYSHKWMFPRFFKFLVGLVIAQPVVGAYNSAFAAASKRIRENKQAYQGTYLESQPTGRIVPANKAVSNEELGNKLWSTTTKFLSGIGL
ncbi:NAD-P-binding protein [Agrocybe pediades]|nr:NAD-P-binding protein [Agrocybe pediades]